MHHNVHVLPSMKHGNGIIMVEDATKAHIKWFRSKHISMLVPSSQRPNLNGEIKAGK